MAADACRVSGSDLPTVSCEKEYLLKLPVWLKALMLATFFGCLAHVAVFVSLALAREQYGFFGAAVPYLFVGIQQPQSMYFSCPSKLTRDGDVWRVFSRFGTVMAEFPTKAIECVEASRSCGNNWIKFKFTDAYIKDLEAKSGCCARCHSGSYVYKDHEKALQEFGF